VTDLGANTYWECKAQARRGFADHQSRLRRDRARRRDRAVGLRARGTMSRWR